jgi:hypothetical protein
MTNEAMSPLRRRMIEDMTIRKLAPRTQEGYIRTIKNFAMFLGRSPDTASFEDVRRHAGTSPLRISIGGITESCLPNTIKAEFSRFSNRTDARRQRNDPEFCPVSVP